jgi:hypothetical protein
MWGYLEMLDLRGLRALGVRFALDLGLHGGNIIFHGWREDHRGFGDWRWSPHFHLIAWGTVGSEIQATLCSMTDNNAAWRGWRAKSVSKVTDHGNLSAQGVARSIIAYELDHCALQAGVTTHYWYGSCHQRALRVVYQTRREVTCCKHCGAVEYVEVDGLSHQVTHLEIYAQVQRRMGYSKRRRRRKWGPVKAIVGTD